MPRTDMKLTDWRRIGARAIVALAGVALLAPRVVGQSADDRYGFVIGPAPAATVPAAPAAAPPVAAAPVPTSGGDSQVLLSYDRNHPPTTSAGNPLREQPATSPAAPAPTIPAPAAATSPLSAAAPFDLAETPLAVQPAAAQQPPANVFAPGGVEPAGLEVPLPATEKTATDASAAPPAVATPLAMAPPVEAPVDAAPKEAAHPATAPITFDSLSKQNDAESTSRRLGPPSSGAALRESSGVASRAASMLPAAFNNIESHSTAGIGLAAVVGLLVVCMWGLRRSGPKRGGALPNEAFAVLGRAPLAAQSFAQLLRVGNKLVLVAITPQGAQALAEVTDPMEVGRLIGICGNGTSHGPSAEFQQVLAQLAREPARGFLEKEHQGGRRA